MKQVFQIFFVLLPALSLAQLSPVKVADGITVSLPPDFRPMSGQEAGNRHVSARKPLALYTDYGATVDFAINRANNQWAQGDLQILKDFYKANILALYHEVSLTKEGIETIGGREFAVFEYTALVKPDEDTMTNEAPLKTYHYVQYVIVNGQSLVFSLSCPWQQKQKWQPLSSQIMQSVAIKKNFK